MFAPTSPDTSALPVSSKPLHRNRKFMLLFTGSTLSVFGNCFHSIALNLWVLQTTGSAAKMSLITVTHMVVSLLLGSVAGTIADRLNRRHLIMLCDSVRFVIVLGIAIVMLKLDQPFVWIVALSALSAVAGLLQSPSSQASITDLVGRDRVQQAAGIMNIADNAARISGLAIGGYIVAQFGGVTAIVTDAILFGLSALLVLAAGQFPQAKRVQAEKSSFRQDWLEGIRRVWSDPFARGVTFLTTIVLLFFVANLMLIQVMAVKVWQASPVHFGLIEAAIPLGYALGAMTIMGLSRRPRNRGIWILGSLLAMGPLYIAIAIMPNALGAIPIILAVGTFFSFCTMLVNVIMRIEVPSELQGRMFGILGSLTSVAPPLGLTIMAALADGYGASNVLLVSGFGLIAAATAAWFGLKAIRGYQ
ncbi:MFS transporter [Paenibacillus methanolicus]|uniref:Putative MFS family arabinose efflux permease n=1 Tax=Paenibacillus methanolicus TaxID=582686 RepID=A0A5S5CI60_9BACL|nr:MFS transporter [Paenibacillus methanolicus]TYP79440.1 putative MFS family arabinose efflux permease [Paenibacillus methanolicus]